MDDQVNAQRSGDASAELMQVRIGRRVFYRADAFREWMISRERGPVVSKRSGVAR